MSMRNKSKVVRFFSVLFLFAVFVQKSLSQENLFQQNGVIVFNKDKGVVEINGVHVLQDSAYIVADTVVFNGAIVTLDHDLTIIARKVLFPKRPEGIVLRPFELIDSQSSKLLIDPLISEIQKSDTLLKFPLSHVIPHIVSVPGLKSKKARDFELKLIPGKVTIIAGRLLGKPMISNQRDFFSKDVKNLELQSVAASSNPSKKLPVTPRIDQFSNVKIYYGSTDQLKKSSIFDPIKEDRLAFLYEQKIEALDFVKHNSVLDLPESVDPFFFYVSLGVDHYLELAKGNHRFTPKNNLKVLLANYESILKDVSTFFHYVSSLSLIEKDEIKVIVGDRLVPLNVYYQEKINNLKRILFERIVESEYLIKDVIENIDPIYVADALKVFCPDNIQQDVLDKALKEFSYSIPDYITLDKGNWVCSIPEISLDQWKRIF